MNRKVWGHRGCRGAGYPPENSLSAFQAAMDAGAGGIELDVRLTSEGVPVVFHDAILERMTGQAGEVSSLFLAEIRKLRLPAKQSIPTLEGVLELVTKRNPGSQFVVNIELKDPKAVDAVAALVRRWKAQRFLISSFDMDSLREMKRVAPELPIGTLFECTAEDLPQKLADASDLKASTVNIPFPSLTPAVLDLIESTGARAVVWTPNESKENLVEFAARLRGREFIGITDFPRELVQMLKPSKARATATGVLAACLCYGQQEMLFRPCESGLEKLKSPSEYPELKRFGFTALRLTAEDGVQITVWERKGDLNRPHFLLFHGNRAHWGDTGGNDRQRDRRARLKFIEELASTGAGVTAVTLRGFGGSSAVPNERGFLGDLRAVTAHVLARGFDHGRLVVAGESLGTWAATQTAVYLTQSGLAPAILSPQNPFTRAADVGERVISHYSIVRSLNIGMSASALDRHVLKHHFYTAQLFQELSTETVVHIATSGKDDLVPPSHSEKLAEIARKRNLRVIHDVYPEALHHNIPPVEFARRLIGVGGEWCRQISDWDGLWGEAVRPTVRIDHIPYL